MLLEDGFITKSTCKNRNYKNKPFIFKKVPAILAILEFLSTAEGLVVSFYDHRMNKAAQGVFFGLHSGDKYAHLMKLWYLNSII